MCHDLTYQSCNETIKDRQASKANKLRKRIGAKPGAFNPLPVYKPKGMHHTTWMRIRNEIQFLENFIFVELGKQIGLLDDKLKGIEKNLHHCE